jgi:hypothetical protein
MSVSWNEVLKVIRDLKVLTTELKGVEATIGCGLQEAMIAFAVVSFRTAFVSTAAA